MGHFSPEMKARYWFITIHRQSLLNMGLEEAQLTDYKLMAEIVSDRWADSGKGRTSASTVCKSEQDNEHMHVVAYTENPTTLRSVSKVLGNCHVEPVLSRTKEQIYNYIMKLPPWNEKGEIILYQYGLENLIEPNQGKRTDLEIIEQMLNDGLSPQDIYYKSLKYRRYERMIMSAYTAKRQKEAPIIKDMHCEWHFGNGRTGKSHKYVELCKEFGRDNIYFLNDFLNGGLDLYMQKGAPHILFIDDVKPQDMSYRMILMLTDRYSDGQSHSRFNNTINLWDTVYVTSVYPIEKYYQEVVAESQRGVDTFDQLIGRFNTVVYHWIDEENSYQSYSLDAKDYKNSTDIKKKARGDWKSIKNELPLPKLTDSELDELFHR